jgi:protein phosphatase
MTRRNVALNVFGRSDVGRVRKSNEDAFVIADLKEALPIHETPQPIALEVGSLGILLAVSDGMCGEQAGEVASALTLQSLRCELPAAQGGTAEAALTASVEKANRRVWDAAADSNRKGMGATLTAVLLHGRRAYVAEVGDSRAYVLRGSRLCQVTHDQSYAQVLFDAGTLTREEVERFKYKNVIMQAMGTRADVVVALNRFTLRRGDRLLLCSDGLSGMIRGDDIRETMIGVGDPFEACKILTDKANQSGGHDNITVLVIEFDGEGLQERSETDEPLAYRKYPLPEAHAETAPVGTVPATPQNLEAAQPSAEAERESRRLRVGHTMVGVQNPLASLSPPTSGDFPPTDRSPGAYHPGDEPIDLPTTGLPPQLVGVIVLGALLLVAVMGFLLLR